MSTTPAGWYPAPNEEGLARWWDGNGWTEHRSPLPPTVEAKATETHTVDWQNPHLGATAAEPLRTPHDREREAREAAEEKAAREEGFVAQGSDIVHNSPGVSGSLIGIIFGVTWIILVGGFVGNATDGLDQRPGEVAAVATIASVTTDDDGSCAPVGTLSVDEKDYQVTTDVFTLPCSIEAGQKIDVLYNPEDVAQTAHVKAVPSFAPVLTLLPFIGWVIVCASAWTLALRIRTAAGGIALVRRLYAAAKHRIGRGRIDLDGTGA